MTLFDDTEREERTTSEAVVPAESPSVRTRLTVAYDGCDFHGFVVQAGLPTVAGALTAALERILGATVELTCAGRTDAGVHARGQVVSFDAPVGAVEPDALVRSVNSMCAPRIVVRDAAVVDDDFDARFSARWRRYRYSVLNAAVPDPFLAATTWWLGEPLDLRAMNLACDPFIGEHDFSSFCRAPKVRAGVQPPSLVRRVRDARWEAGSDGLVHFWVEADAFCHQMVRSLTGTIVEVGQGKRRAGEMTSVLRARDRHAAGQMAPAHGLCLWEVGYR